MPDKKTTGLTEKITAVIGADLLPLVGNTAATPTNYKIQVKNFLSNLALDLPQTTLSALKLYANVTANAVAATLTAAEFGVFSNSSVNVTVRDRYGLLVTNKIGSGNSNVTGQMAAALFTLDTGNSNCVSTNVFGIMIRHELDANTAAARFVAPRAFIAIQDNAGTNAAALTSYLMDIGAGGKLVSANTSANASQILTVKGSAVHTHTLKIRVNGADYWLMASNVAPA